MVEEKYGLGMWHECGRGEIYTGFWRVKVEEGTEETRFGRPIGIILDWMFKEQNRGRGLDCLFQGWDRWRDLVIILTNLRVP